MQISFKNVDELKKYEKEVKAYNKSLTRKDTAEDTFILIQHWMIKLNLTGQELLAYAFIYNQCSNNADYVYYAGNQYIADVIGANDKKRASKILNSLVEKGLLIKLDEQLPNGMCKYKIFDKDVVEDIQEIVGEKNEKKIMHVVNYFNQVLDTKYTLHDKARNGLVNNLLNAGFTVDDLKLTIDDVKTWPSKYQTISFNKLFGEGFEEYYNKALKKKQADTLHISNWLEKQTTQQNVKKERDLNYISSSGMLRF